jgi:hypothetical protein
MKPQHIGGIPPGRYNMLWGWDLEKLGLEPPTPSMLGATTGVGAANPVYAWGDHKQWRQLTCIALAVAFCEILPLRKPFPNWGLKAEGGCDIMS